MASSGLCLRRRVPADQGNRGGCQGGREQKMVPKRLETLKPSDPAVRKQILWLEESPFGGGLRFTGHQRTIEPITSRRVLTDCPDALFTSER